MTLYSKIDKHIYRTQWTYENIDNYRTGRQNIVIDFIMNLDYIFVIIKCESYCKTKS